MSLIKDLIDRLIDRLVGKIDEQVLMSNTIRVENKFSLSNLSSKFEIVIT